MSEARAPRRGPKKTKVERLAGQAKRALCMLRGADARSRLELASYLASSALTRATGSAVNRREVELRLSGFDVRVQTFSSQLGAYADIFFLDEYEQIPGFASGPGETVVDAGANVGFFSLRHARSVGRTGRVFAFEPNPSVFRLLRENVERNGLSQVSCHQVALGEQEGSLRFAVDPRSTSCGHVAEAHEAGDAVSVTTLDAFVEQQGIARIDLLKLDVEGHEPHILRGGARRALDLTRRVVMESHLTRDTAWDILRPLGFRKAYDGFSPNVVYFTRDKA